MCGHDFWHGGQAGRHLGQVDRSRSRGRKMFIWMFHWLLIAYSMDLLKKKLRNTTGGNKTWGVFKAYVVFFVTTQGEQKCIKGVHSENTSRSLKCTLSIHFTTERCCERCGKTYFKVYSPPQLWKLWAGNSKCYPFITPRSLGVLEGLSPFVPVDLCQLPDTSNKVDYLYTTPRL